MAEIPEWLTREVGPLPVGGWLVVGVAGVGLGAVIHRNLGDPGQLVDEGLADTGAAAGSTPVVYRSPLGGATGSVGGPILLPPGLPTGDPAGPSILSNAEWLNAAVVALVESGDWTPFAAQQSLQRYLEGRATGPDSAAVDAAIIAVGPPPEGAPVSVPVTPSAPLSPPPVYVDPGPAPQPTGNESPGPAPGSGVTPPPVSGGDGNDTGDNQASRRPRDRVLIVTTTRTGPRSTTRGIARRYYRTTDAKVVDALARRNGLKTRGDLAPGRNIRLPPSVAGVRRRRHRQ